MNIATEMSFVVEKQWSREEFEQSPTESEGKKQTF
jgi:hypothetical protein